MSLLQLIARPEGGLTARVSLPLSPEPSLRDHRLLRQIGA